MSRTNTNGTQHNEHGGALAFVLLVAVATLLIGGLALHLTLSERKTVTTTLHAMSAQRCAETGLEIAKRVVAVNATDWAAVLAGCGGSTPCPSWYPIMGNCAEPGGFTYTATMRDNVDELLPTANDPTTDTDGFVIVDVQALKGTAEAARVSAMVVVTGNTRMSDYQHQHRQGAQKTGNQ